MKRTSAWLIAPFFLVGCVNTMMHTPEPVPISEDMLLQEFQADSSISLTNAVVANNRTTEKDREWTDSVIAFLSGQLEQRGATIVEDSPQKLNLQVVLRKQFAAASWLTLAAPEGCEITVRAETGDGYSQEYNVKASAYFWQVACDKGVTTIVVNLLNDPEMRQYLALSDHSKTEE